MSEDIDAQGTREIVCPWCGHEHGDSWEMSNSGRIECDECEKPFDYERDIEVSYSSYKPKPSDIMCYGCINCNTSYEVAWCMFGNMDRSKDEISQEILDSKGHLPNCGLVALITEGEK